MIIIRKGNHSTRIVNIVKMLSRVIWIVDDDCTTETIAVLGGEMAVVPECSSLVAGWEGVEEGGVGCDGALVVCC